LASHKHKKLISIHFTLLNMADKKLKVQNFFEIVTTSDIPITWDAVFTVSVAPANSRGFVVVSPNNAAWREIMFYNSVGTTLTAKKENRGLGWTSMSAHSSNEPIALKDVAEIFNFFSDNLSQAFFVEKTGWLTVDVWGGFVNYNGALQEVTTTSFTLTDNAVNYVKYDYPTNVLSVSTSAVWNNKAIITVNSGVIISIVYQIAKESFIDFSVTINNALPSQVWQWWKVLWSDWTNTWWVPKNDYVTDTGTANTYVAALPTFQLSVWSEISVKISNANTWASTININWTWVKNIKKNVNADLTLWDILSWQILKLIYDGTNYQLIWSSAVWWLFAWTSTDTLVTNSPVWIWYDWMIYNVPTIDRGTFTQIDWAWVWTYITQRYLWANTYLFWYMRGTTVYAKAWTLVNNVWTYGTEVTIRTGMTANTGVVSALINTNKVVLWWFETATSMWYIVCTVTWTTISIGAVVTQWTWWTGTWSFLMEKIDTDRFILAMNSGSDSRYVIWTVTGTVPSLWSYTVVGTNLWVKVTFLSNWYAWIMFQNATTIAHRIIYSASGTTTTTTYTLADTSAVTNQGAICRYNDTSYAYYNGGTTITKITIPGAWTTLVSSSLITWLSAIVNCDMCNIADSIFSLVSTTIGYMFQWSKILITFSGISSIIVAWTVSACNIISDGKYIFYFNSSSSNWIPTYLSLLANQIIGAVQNNSTVILVNGAISIWTGIIPGSRYFSWNPLNNSPNSTNVPYAIWLSTTQLLIQ